MNISESVGCVKIATSDWISVLIRIAFRIQELFKGIFFTTELYTGNAELY